MYVPWLFHIWVGCGVFICSFYEAKISGLEWGISLVLSGDFIFILQILTISKMKKSQAKTVSSFTKQKLAALKPLELWATFECNFFYVLGGKKFFDGACTVFDFDFQLS